MLLRSATVSGFPLSLPLLFLLLLLGGLGVAGRDLLLLRRYRWPLLGGLVAVWCLPLTALQLLQLTSAWGLPEGGITQVAGAGVLVGLTLVAMMPAAASSVGWSQLSHGNVTISVGLVFFSTLLTPVVLDLIGSASRSPGPLVGGMELMCWILPAVLLGIAFRGLLGPSRASDLRPYTRILSAAILLLLNYLNAAIALPRVTGHIASGMLVVTILLTALLCALGFVGGWVVSRLVRNEPAAAHALVFGVGMKNTGMALVLAGLWLESFPLATVVIITYTLIQHVLAGCYQAAMHGR